MNTILLAFQDAMNKRKCVSACKAGGMAFHITNLDATFKLRIEAVLIVEFLESPFSDRVSCSV